MVRNAISRILDRYTLGDIVEPFGIAPALASRSTETPSTRHADPRDGLLAVIHFNEKMGRANHVRAKT